MSTISSPLPAELSPAAGDMPATPVQGPRLAGVWRRVGIGAWAVLFLLCLSALFMSVAYADLWFRTPYTSITQLAPDITAETIAETLQPFQEAISALGLSLSLYSHYFTLLRLLAGLPYFVLSFLIMRRRSDRLMAVLFAMLCCLLGAAGTIFNPLWSWIPPSYPWNPALSSLLSAFLYCGVIILYTFPDGRFVPRWTLGLAWVVVPYALAANFAPPGSWWDPYSVPAPLNFLPSLVFIGGGIIALNYRYRRDANVVQKQQLKWFLAGAALIVLSWFIDFAVWQIYPSLTGGEALIQAGRQAVLWELFQDTAWYIAQLAFAVCIAISIFRYRLWDIDLVVNRVLVYASLTALTMLVYLASVSLLGSLFEGLAQQWAFFLATGVVAILFEPLRQRLQRMVNRLMYGERDDPYKVLTRLSSALETASTPQAALSELAAQIGGALKLPGVAIYLVQGGGGEQKVAAIYGRLPGDPLIFPLVYQDEQVGSLHLARRAPGEDFSSADLRLIENVARQTGASAQAARLNIQLSQSRAQVVVEREEERLRIRRDLHDELGPRLASQGLRLAAARQMLRSAPQQAEALLDEVALQSQMTMKDIRRMVHGLRPPALDQLGLVDAVRDMAPHEAVGLVFDVSAAPQELPPLPAAVEVNAYRIALEGMANAARHSQARRCTVAFSVEPAGALLPAALLVQVSDDGVGLPAHYREGVGLRSMRQRAEELGGSLRIAALQPHGTHISAWLPFPVPD